MNWACIVETSPQAPFSSNALEDGGLSPMPHTHCPPVWQPM
jgi:hypothetical protein